MWDTWRLSAGDETRVMDGKSNPICDVKCGGMSGRTVVEGERIARMIAAAPYLLAVAERILDRGYVSKHIGEEHDDHMALVFAIGLTKATNP